MIQDRTIVVSAFIRDGDKYLIVYDPRFRFWRVPGGRWEQGESEEETLHREMFDELGIKIEIEKYMGEGVDDNVKMYGHENYMTSRLIRYYRCSITSGIPYPKDSNEIQELKWETASEIRNTDNLEPAMKDFFSRRSFGL